MQRPAGNAGKEKDQCCIVVAGGLLTNPLWHQVQTLMYG